MLNTILKCEFCDKVITGHYYEVIEITTPDRFVCFGNIKGGETPSPAILGECCVAPMKTKGYTIRTIQYPIPPLKKNATAEEIDALIRGEN